MTVAAHAAEEEYVLDTDPMQSPGLHNATPGLGSLS